MEQPLISVAILTYKRQEMLMQAIASVLQQDYPDFEILVIDNHSEDGTPALIKKKFHRVRCFALPENTGSAARNVGFEHARGEIVVTLDNDVFFGTPEELGKILHFFQNNSDTACATFKILQPDGKTLSLRDWFHPKIPEQYADKSFQTYYIAEGASAFRKNTVLQAGGYDKDFFLGHEGLDLALKILQLGYKIEYTPEISVCHHAAVATRTSWRPYFYNTRNYFLLWFKYFRWRLGLRFLLPRIVMHGLFALRTGNIKYYFRGVIAGFRDGKAKLSERQPLAKRVEKHFRQMLSTHPGFFHWLKRHRKKPQV